MIQFVKSKSFNKGLREIKRGEYNEVVLELKEALGVNCRQAFAHRRDGLAATLDVEVAARIEAIFVKRGVEDPWGE